VHSNPAEYLRLTVDDRTTIALADDSRFLIGVHELTRLSFADVARAEVAVGSSEGIAEIGVGARRVTAAGADIPRDRFVGRFVFRHTDSHELRVAVIDHSVRLTLNVVIELSPGTVVRFASEFESVSRDTPITVTGNGGKVIFESRRAPEAVAVRGEGISIVTEGLGGGAIAGIVIAVVAVVGIAAGALVCWRRRARTKLVVDYDTVPDATLQL
jgi:hypothetical protein